MTVFERIAFYLGIFATLVLLGMIFLSENGVTDYGRLAQKEAELAAQAAREDALNRKLAREIRSLKQDLNYIKHLAKHEHEMAEPDELIFKDNAQKETPKP